MPPLRALARTFNEYLARFQLAVKAGGGRSLGGGRARPLVGQLAGESFMAVAAFPCHQRVREWQALPEYARLIPQDGELSLLMVPAD